jgi:adenylate kinase
MLTSRGEAIDKAIYIEVPEKELLKRLSRRWICRKCQAPYHELTSPPKVAQKCDKCDGELYQRSDDAVETVKERLKVYFAQTTPVLDYYKAKGKLIAVNGKLGIEEVAEGIIDVLKPKSVRAG